MHEGLELPAQYPLHDLICKSPWRPRGTAHHTRRAVFRYNQTKYPRLLANVVGRYGRENGLQEQVSLQREWSECNCAGPPSLTDAARRGEVLGQGLSVPG